MDSQKESVSILEKARSMDSELKKTLDLAERLQANILGLAQSESDAKDNPSCLIGLMDSMADRIRRTNAFLFNLVSSMDAKPVQAITSNGHAKNGKAKKNQANGATPRRRVGRPRKERPAEPVAAE